MIPSDRGLAKDWARALDGSIDTLDMFMKFGGIPMSSGSPEHPKNLVKCFVSRAAH
jgi:hypothetical protein